MEFFRRNIAFIAIVLTTIILLVGGVFLFSGKGGSGSSGQELSNELLTPSNSYRYSSGSAELTLVEFGDFQCPACSAYHTVVKQLLSDYGGRLNFVFRHFPLSQHKNALISSYAVEAAGLQGKFWEMYDKIYTNQATWSESNEAKGIFIGYAEALGLDTKKFEEDIGSESIKSKVQRDAADGNNIGINSTPTFFLEGKEIAPPLNYDQFKAIVEKALQE